MAEAITRYLNADSAPALALAQREHAVCIRAASEAMMKLLSAVEEFSGRVVFSGELRHSHGALLAAHQETWTRAVKVILPGRHDALVLRRLHQVWRRTYLRILIDRMEETSTVHRFGDVEVVRLFGTMCTKVQHIDEILFTDKENLYFNLSPKQQNEPFILDSVIPAMCKALPPLIRRGDRDHDAAAGPVEVVYSYGPIGRNDDEIRLEAMRMFSASLDFIYERMLSFSGMCVSTLKKTDSFYEYIDAQKITPTEFSRALRPYRYVDAHTIMVGLSRYRLKRVTRSERAQTTAHVRPTKKTAKHEKNRHIPRNRCARQAKGARRKPATT